MIVKEIKYIIKYIVNLFFCLLFYPLKIKNNKIVIVNFYGKGFGDNGKPIYEELKRRNNIYDIVWLVRDKYSDMPKDIKQVKIRSIAAYYELSTSKIWIDNHRKEAGMLKKKKQVYIQTWHSSIRLKKIEKEAERFLPDYYIRQAKYDSKMISYLTCGSGFSRKTYAESFWYSGPILMTGSPRYDRYFTATSSTERLEILKRIGIKGGDIILYAPTFRKNNPGFAGNLNLRKLNRFLSEMGSTLLIRLHPGSNIKIRDMDYIKDASSYPDLQSLIKNSSLVITDYSGLCFDALVAKKPCLLYTPDIEEYLRSERGLCFGVDELPFKSVRTQKELEEVIRERNYGELMARYADFSKKVDLREDGMSTIRICNLIDSIVGDLE